MAVSRGLLTRASAAGAVGILSLVCLSACTGSTPQPTTPVIPKNTVIATGVLSSWDNSVSGEVRVIQASNGDFDFTFPNLTTTATRGLQVLLAPAAIALDIRCYPGSVTQIPLDQKADRTKPSVWPGSELGLPLDDPSFIQDVAITQDNAGTETCETPVWAVAKLSWHVPDMDPTLDVIDSGPVSAANGVMSTHNGRPWSYTIVADDEPGEVAKRFNLSKVDMAWLNPEFGSPTTYEIGQVINLSPANR